MGGFKREHVPRECLGGAAMDVSRQLIGNDDVCERSSWLVEPVRECALFGSIEQRMVMGAVAVEVSIWFKPAFTVGFVGAAFYQFAKPEIQDSRPIVHALKTPALHVVREENRAVVVLLDSLAAVVFPAFGSVHTMAQNQHSCIGLFGNSTELRWKRV